VRPAARDLSSPGCGCTALRASLARMNRGGRRHDGACRCRWRRSTSDTRREGGPESKRYAPATVKETTPGVEDTGRPHVDIPIW
jgi:hypothetical protein